MSQKMKKNTDILFLADTQEGKIIILLYLIQLLRSNKEHLHSQKEPSSACLKLILFYFFFYQRCWSILYSFSELMHSDQTLEYKRLNFSANYMPEGTLTMQVSMLC